MQPSVANEIRGWKAALFQKMYLFIASASVELSLSNTIILKWKAGKLLKGCLETTVRCNHMYERPLIVSTILYTRPVQKYYTPGPFQKGGRHDRITKGLCEISQRSAYHKREAQRPLRPGSRARLRSGVLDALG